MDERKRFFFVSQLARENASTEGSFLLGSNERSFLHASHIECKGTSERRTLLSDRGARTAPVRTASSCCSASSFIFPLPASSALLLPLKKHRVPCRSLNPGRLRQSSEPSRFSPAFRRTPLIILDASATTSDQQAWPEYLQTCKIPKTASSVTDFRRSRIRP